MHSSELCFCRLGVFYVGRSEQEQALASLAAAFLVAELGSLAVSATPRKSSQETIQLILHWVLTE